MKPVVKSHIITSEAVNDVKGFNDSCYRKSSQLIKISSYDKIDVELFFKYLLSLKIILDLNIFDQDKLLYSHKSEKTNIVLNLIQVNKIFRYSEIVIGIPPQLLSEVNIKNLKDKYSQCNIIKGENYCLAKCLVIFLSYAKEEFARLFNVDINILTPSKIKAIRSHSESELLSWASILSDKFLNKKSENYTSTDVQTLANAFNICIKVFDIDGKQIVKYDKHSPESIISFAALLFYHNNHYAAVTKESIRNSKHKLCQYCFGVNDNNSHLYRCKKLCTYCQNYMGDCTKIKEYNCTLCNRTLVSDNCYQGHFSSRICSRYPLCNVCNKPIPVSATGIRALHQCYEKNVLIVLL